MFNKFFLAPAILSVVGLLMGADAAFAQGGGHSSSGGHTSSGHSSPVHSNSHVGGGSGGGWHGGTNHHGDYHHNSFYPGVFGGYGLGSYGVGGYGLGAYGYDNYSYPRYSYYNGPAAPYYSPQADYYMPPTQYYVAPTAVAADYARVDVVLPDPQARVWFDGTLTNQTGTERVFNTPSLTMGAAYTYQVRASWMQGGQEVSHQRAVSVSPGRTTVVDFTR
jgi:uncharacterized protein (TIGR03000 family)